jgi:hypothetical protein
LPKAVEASQVVSWYIFQFPHTNPPPFSLRNFLQPAVILISWNFMS